MTMPVPAYIAGAKMALQASVMIMQRICFAVALWNGKDPILKERLFGLTGNEGNHGEDVKELYYYLDNTPSHSYMKHLYKYPHGSLSLCGSCAIQTATVQNMKLNMNCWIRVFSMTVNILMFLQNMRKMIRKIFASGLLFITAVHETGYIALLPTLWLRNLWSFGIEEKSSITRKEDRFRMLAVQKSIIHCWADYHFYFENPVRTLLTENETNTERLYGQPNKTPFVKDAFHDAVINSRL